MLTPEVSKEEEAGHSKVVADKRGILAYVEITGGDKEA